MKRCFAISFLFLISLLVFKDWISYANFYWNQDYIAANLCINIDEPLLMCSGQCYLETSIISNHEQKENVPQPSQEERNGTVYLPINRIYPTFQLQNVKKSNPILFHGENYSFAYLGEVFRPPCV